MVEFYSEPLRLFQLAILTADVIKNVCVQNRVHGQNSNKYNWLILILDLVKET